MPNVANREQFNLDLKEWQAAVDWIARAKAREMELRLKIADQLFSRTASGDFPEGTSHSQVEYGEYDLVGKLAVQYKYEVLDESLAPTIKEMGEKWNPSLIRIKHSLDKKVFDALPPEARKTMQKTLVIKPQAPKLELDLVKRTV